MTSKRHSQDNSSTEDCRCTKRDDESICSTLSTTSSVFSTSSKLSKLPGAVKSSVKQLFTGREERRSSTSTSFASRLKRHTPTLIFRKSEQYKQQQQQPTNSSNGNLKSKRRNSIIQISHRFNMSRQHAGHDDTEDIIEYYRDEQKKPQRQQQQQQSRQREKSCQDNKAPMLHQLAHKELLEMPLLKGLVTTTLTTLHTRLINECDRTLSMVLLAANNNHTIHFPQEQLLSIILDLYKMTEMVHWDHQEELKREVKYNIQLLERQAQEEAGCDDTIATVKEMINTMKQIMNQCICQYYKVAERAMVIPCKGYRIEGKNRYGITIDQLSSKTMTISEQVEHMDKDAYWYRDYFMGNANTCHFFGYKEGDPLLISAIVEHIDDKKRYRIIYRSKQNPDQRKVIMDSFLLNAPLLSTCDTKNNDYIPDTTWKTIIETTFNIPFHSFKKMSNELMISSGLEEELLKLDEYSLHKRYKFGVLLIKEGQTKEEEWFANEHDCPAFEEFLNIIGKKIKLKGYNGWAAGLDRRGGDSGEYTYTNTWYEHVLAYHVSSLIPSRPGDKQQVQRKRHIGNDIVCIIFVEGNQPFNPTAIKSQFLHVFIVVHQEIWASKKIWRVEVVTVEDVPSFGPSLPDVFDNEQDLSNFILAKLINAEYAALKSPKFSHPMARAREGIFSNIVDKGWKILEEMDRTSTVTAIATTNVSSDTSGSSITTTTSTNSTISTASTSNKKKFHVKTASTSSSISTIHSIKHIPSESCIPSPTRSSLLPLSEKSNQERQPSQQPQQHRRAKEVGKKKSQSELDGHQQHSFKQRLFTSFPALKKSSSNKE